MYDGIMENNIRTVKRILILVNGVSEFEDTWRPQDEVLINMQSDAAVL